MSFPLTEPQTVMLILAIGSTIYIYAMVRASVSKFKPKAPTAAEEHPSANVLPPPPPPPSETPGASTEQKPPYHSFLNGHPRFKKLLRIDDTPIDKKLKQLVSTQRQQAERCTMLEERIRELKFAVEMKPDPPQPKPPPTHLSSRKDNHARKPTEDAEWKEEQKDKSDRTSRRKENEDDSWKKEEQNGK